VGHGANLSAAFPAHAQPLRAFMQTGAPIGVARIDGGGPIARRLAGASFFISFLPALLVFIQSICRNPTYGSAPGIEAKEGEAF
jgi:hypothetical protein